MKRKLMKFEIKERTRNIAVLVIILILILVMAYFNFFWMKKCDDIVCFNTALAKCKKASFLNGKDESAWFYVIKGSKQGDCIVYVKNTQINIEEANKIKGKEMLCYLPRGMVIQPESDLDKCHGLLKEALQDIIIERLHVYIVQNIGQITEGIEKPI